MSKRYRQVNNLYVKSIITKKISIPMKHITNNLKNLMQQMIENEISNKCIVEGYIKPNSIVIVSHSNGIQENQNIKFQVVFECLVCNPCEGQFINCVAKNITKAGIRAEVDDDDNPLIIFVARDHNYLNKLFSNVKVDQKIVIRVIGSRFELHDLKISVIGEIIKLSKISSLNVGDVLENPNIDINVEHNDDTQKIDSAPDEEPVEEVDADDADDADDNDDAGKDDDEEIGEVDNKSVNESVDEEDDDADNLSSNNDDDSAENAEDVDDNDGADVANSELNK